MPENMNGMNWNGGGIFLLIILFFIFGAGGNGFGNNNGLSNESVYSNTKLDNLQICCCEQKLQACENTNQLMRETINQGSMTRELINAQETARLREQLNRCENALALAGQTQVLTDRFGTWYSNPCCYPCSVNSGACGCGTSF